MICILEDNETERMVLEAVARKAKQEWRSFGEPSSFIDYVLQHPPSLALVDYNLPGHNGLEVLTLVRNSGLPRFPFIMVTGESDYYIGETAFERGFDDFVTKPVKPGELAHRIRLEIELQLQRIATAGRVCDQVATNMARLRLGGPRPLAWDIMKDNSPELDCLSPLEASLQIAELGSFKVEGDPELLVLAPVGQFYRLLSSLVRNADRVVVGPEEDQVVIAIRSRGLTEDGIGYWAQHFASQHRGRFSVHREGVELRLPLAESA